MKIVSWNIRNVGRSKLTNSFSTTFRSVGLGNNVLDYIINIVMGSSVWGNINTTVPADIFVIIELKSGGTRKGDDASGAAEPVLKSIVAAMNTIASGNSSLSPNYDYDYVKPKIVGYHESVGVIFNKKSLNYVSSSIVKDNNNNNILPRTPFQVDFQTVVGSNAMSIMGIHAPPTSGSGYTLYKDPIQFARTLSSAPALTGGTNMSVMGDYNCAPNSVYNSGSGNVGWSFTGYTTSIPNGTLTSVRLSVDNSQLPPANYLSAAYDNLLRNFNPTGVSQNVLDTIGNARNVTVSPATPLYPTNVVMVLNNFNIVSDHLPITMQF